MDIQLSLDYHRNTFEDYSIQSINFHVINNCALYICLLVVCILRIF